MDVEVHVDRTAYRRHRRGMFISLLAFALYLPAVILILTLMAAVLGREAARQYTGAVFITGFVALMATTFWGHPGFVLLPLPALRPAVVEGSPPGSIRAKHPLSLRGLPFRMGSRLGLE